jgi:hypothetical protein
MGKPAFASFRAELLAAAAVLMPVEESAAAPESQAASVARSTGPGTDQSQARLDWQSPGSLRWTFRGTSVSATRDRTGPAIGRATRFSGLTLFQSGRVSAEWSPDGRIHYRLSGPTPLGANVGGTIAPNAAKVKFSWITSK